MRHAVLVLASGLALYVFPLAARAAAENRTPPDPGDVQAIVRQARSLCESGQSARAAELLESSLAQRQGDETLEFELLTVKESQGHLTPQQAATLEALRQERQAASELAVGAIRLGMVRARARLAQGRYEEAARTARAALERLDTLPADVDRAALRASLDDILRQVEVAAARASIPAAQTREPLTLADFGFLPQETADEAARETKAETPPAETAAPPAAPSPPPSPVDAGTISRPEQIDSNFQAYHDTQLVRWGENPNIYQRVLEFPSYWPEICELRKQYASGLLYRGPDFVGDDGKARHTAVYDIADLTADIPHFNAAPVLDLHTILQSGADRVALRQYNDIFTGGPADLAAGNPLLGYFGGVDEFHLPPVSPGTQYQYSDIVRMVDDVLSEK